LGHNTPFLSAVMDQPRFGSGQLSTNYIADEFPEGFHGLPPSPWQIDVITAAAAAMHRMQAARARRSGNGLMGPVRDTWVVVVGHTRRTVRLAERDGALTIEFLDEGRQIILEGLDWRPGSPMLGGMLDGRPFTVTVSPAAEGFTIRHRAASAKAMVLTPTSADLHERLPAKTPPDTSRIVVSPMPGLVISCDIAQGEEVKEGQVLFVIEAMKMQNIIRAERDGVIKTLSAKAGDSVAADDVLAEFG